jgi:hypothetical protein
MVIAIIKILITITINVYIFLFSLLMIAWILITVIIIITKMVLRNIGCEGVDWIRLAEDRIPQITRIGLTTEAEIIRSV